MAPSLDALRVAEAPMTATELAKAVLAEAGIQTDDNKGVIILWPEHSGQFAEITPGKAFRAGLNEGMVPARWQLKEAAN